jgi:hypothetical protein
VALLWCPIRSVIEADKANLQQSARLFRFILTSAIHKQPSFADQLTNSDRLVDPSNPSISKSTANSVAESESCLSTAASTPNPLCANLRNAQESTSSAAEVSPLFQTSNSESHNNPSADISTASQQRTFTDHTTSASKSTPTEPIQIPTIRIPVQELEHTYTPVSARNSPRQDLFPHPRTPSPAGLIVARPSDQHHFSPESDDNSSGRGRGRRSSSSSSRSLIFSMHGEQQYTGRYMPTSPLSPKLPSSSRPLLPQHTTSGPSQPRPTSRNLHMTLPRYHPANFGLGNHAPSTTSSVAATPSSTVQSPAITLNRVNAPLQIDSPRSMRDRQREMLENVRISSMMASQQKPGAPKLNPLGSPKGPVTPLALEEGGDYFSISRTGKTSPAMSPGAKSGHSSRSGEGSPRQRPERESSQSLGKKRVDVYE